MSRLHPKPSHPVAGWLFVLPWDVRLAGGVSVVVANLARECTESDLARPLLLIESWEHPDLSEGELLGLTVARFRIRNPIIPDVGIRSVAAFLVTLPSTLLVLARFLRRHSVAVINVHYPGLWAIGFLMMRYLRLFRGRVLVSIHGSDIFLGARKSGFERWLLGLILGLSDAVIACSAHLGRECSDAFPSVAKNINVIRNGVDVRGIEQAAQRERLPDELQKVAYVLSVGNFQETKGHDVLLRAFARIATSHPALHLVCVGRPGPTLPALKAMSLQCDLGGRVHFVEDVTTGQVGVYYANARLFAHPARREALGIAILEAGVLRKPVVASRVGGIPEILRDGENGILVAPDDDAALAEAIELLLNDPELGNHLGENLHRDVCQHFTWSRAWTEYVALSGLRAGDRNEVPVP